MRLPGVGEVTANRIIEARPFKDVQGLRNVEGIGPKTFRTHCSVLADSMSLRSPAGRRSGIHLNPVRPKDKRTPIPVVGREELAAGIPAANRSGVWTGDPFSVGRSSPRAGPGGRVALESLLRVEGRHRDRFAQAAALSRRLDRGGAGPDQLFSGASSRSSGSPSAWSWAATLSGTNSARPSVAPAWSSSRPMPRWMPASSVASPPAYADGARPRRSFASNGSGDYAIAFTVNPGCRIPHGGRGTRPVQVLADDDLSPLFLAVVEATEEAVLSSLFAATTTRGLRRPRDGGAADRPGDRNTPPPRGPHHHSASETLRPWLEVDSEALRAECPVNP